MRYCTCYGRLLGDGNRSYASRMKNTGLFKYMGTVRPRGGVNELGKGVSAFWGVGGRVFSPKDLKWVV